MLGQKRPESLQLGLDQRTEVGVFESQLDLPDARLLV